MGVVKTASMLTGEMGCSPSMSTWQHLQASNMMFPLSFFFISFLLPFFTLCQLVEKLTLFMFTKGTVYRCLLVLLGFSFQSKAKLQYTLRVQHLRAGFERM